MIRRLIPQILLFLLFLCGLHGQTRRFDPSASRISTEISGRSVVITWRDAPDSPDAVYEIWRSRTRIDAETLDDAVNIAAVAAGRESYVDSPQNEGEWWYAVLMVVSGERMMTFIPWRNSIGAPVRMGMAGVMDGAPSRILAFEAAETSTGRIALSVSADSPGRSITIFRTPAPFSFLRSLDYAVTVGTVSGRGGMIQDEPAAGISWYYAAVDEEIPRRLPDDWNSFAAFTAPIRIAAGQVPETRTPIRPAPLPTLRVTRDFEDGRPLTGIGKDFPIPQDLSPETLAVLENLIVTEQGRPRELPEPQVLPEDRGFVENRHSRSLRDILQGSFARQEWQDADMQLFALAAVNGLEPTFKARLLFYRGQCLYFSGELEESFLSFLIASQHYYTQARSWMNRIHYDISPVGP